MQTLTNEQHSQRWQRYLGSRRQSVQEREPFIVEGKLTRMVGLTLEAAGCQAPVGGRCVIQSAANQTIEAEVVGFSGDRTYLMPTGDIRGLLPNSRVIPTGKIYDAAVGGDMMGRVISGVGKPLDGRGPINSTHRVPLTGVRKNPLERQPIRDVLDVGVRAINGLLTVGRGQRLGLFAGSGVGKSVLLGMMTRYTNADVIVVALVGERGREVKEFVDDTLGQEGLARSIVVATPADDPPLLRMHGAMLATSIAEHYRDQGKHVLLLMDSLTRFAQAQREIALAIGEPPATKGYPPSAFAKLPALVERAGNGGVNGGSITGLYTVLAEGDDQQDPIVDAARAILDGHIVLSRKMADSGCYPAIDIEASISRTKKQITNAQHQSTARCFREFYSKYQQNKDLISVGAYTAGADPELDRAVSLYPNLVNYLKQDIDNHVSFNDSVQQLDDLFMNQSVGNAG
ncbi:MAG: flagellar protein export ATPase FliI [Thiotrichales bacterium]|nr:flagellar protein export ATPase FliI [Thiotrichales bacterium]